MQEALCMKKLLAFILVLICIFSLVACNGKPIIVSIRQANEDGAAIQVLEFFYEDDNARYYFPTPRSRFITVTCLNGESENIIPALESGRVTIADLDRFGIKYYTEEKQ